MKELIFGGEEGEWRDRKSQKVVSPVRKFLDPPLEGITLYRFFEASMNMIRKIALEGSDFCILRYILKYC